MASLLLSFGVLAAACGSDVAVDNGTSEAADAATEVVEEEAMEDETASTDEAMEDDVMEDDVMEDDAMEDDQAATLELTFAGLEPLANGVHYEGWIVVDGAPVSTGNFNVDADGSLIDLDGASIASPFEAIHTDRAEAVVISIEPADDGDPAPSAIKVLGGDVVDGQAELTTAHPAAIGTDFTDASGVYILGTPTTAVGDDELSGVWFIGLDGGAVQGLDLPELNEGWIYEGWAVIDGVPVSTGRFTDPAAGDDFNGFSGVDATGPNYPGEDFITNAPDGVAFPTDLRDGVVVISVEPIDDDSPAPFALKPLVSEVADGIDDHVVQEFGQGPAAITGTAVLG